MENFGFNISSTRVINIDECDLENVKKLYKEVSSFKRCISCGACTATCSARQFTDFNIRKLHAFYRRGQYEGLQEALKACMLCGKCTLVCPRGVNLRSMIINMRKILHETNKQ